MGRKAATEIQEVEQLPTYSVIQRFQAHKDHGGAVGDNATFHEVGDDVSHFEQERLDNAVALGLVQYNPPAEESTEEA